MTTNGSIDSLMEVDDRRISITLQFGSHKEVLSLERTADLEVLESFRQRARILSEKHSDSGTRSTSSGELYLFRHDYQSSNMLQLLTSLDQLDNGSVVEVILVDRNERPTRPHVYEIGSYITPTFCDYCGEMLVGLIKQGLKCAKCHCNFHKKCAFASRNNCAKNISIIDAKALDTPTQADFSLPHTLAVHNYKKPTVCKVCNCLLLGLMKQGLQCRDCRVNVHKKCARDLPLNCQLGQGAVGPTTQSFDRMSVDGTRGHVDEEQTTDSLIPLARLPGQASVRQKANFQPIIEGWLVHFALDQPNRRLRHYWILLGTTVSLYGEHNYDDKSNKTLCTNNAQTWFSILSKALQPPSTPREQANSEPALQFTELYQVLGNQTLGSGQFGTVYGGVHRTTGREVAVKVIAKERFVKKSGGADTFRNEVAILQAVSHQGIIRLEAMFETIDKIFVVMEKMNGDMLEMILSQASGRLDERTTRFLIVQILSALLYLHSKGIAHCDLKPENVLLSDMSSNYTRTKLCDFGYARFIGDAQFRKTIVGTPAYLAPEVLQKRGYNKSLDMWSVGVIIYVTLSGTFPFNDGEEISDQIQNAAFMFPKDPWVNITKTAIDLIGRLLKVQINERLQIEECLAHEWLQDVQLYLDLRNLELKAGPNADRYLTSIDDDRRYANFIHQQQ